MIKAQIPLDYSLDKAQDKQRFIQCSGRRIGNFTQGECVDWDEALMFAADMGLSSVADKDVYAYVVMNFFDVLSVIRQNPARFGDEFWVFDGDNRQSWRVLYAGRWDEEPRIYGEYDSEEKAFAVMDELKGDFRAVELVSGNIIRTRKSREFLEAQRIGDPHYPQSVQRYNIERSSQNVIEHGAVNQYCIYDSFRGRYLTLNSSKFYCQVEDTAQYIITLLNASRL